MVPVRFSSLTEARVIITERGDMVANLHEEARDAVTCAFQRDFRDFIDKSPFTD